MTQRQAELLAGAVSGISQGGDSALLGAGLVRELRLCCLLLASGLIKPSDLFSNSLFFEKRKAALMEAFKIQELWIPLLCQSKSGFI